MRRVYFTGIAGGELLKEGEPGLSFDQGEDTVTQVAADDGVAFPVNGALVPADAAVDGSWLMRSVLRFLRTPQWRRAAQLQ